MIRPSRVLQALVPVLLAAVSLTCSGDKLILPDEGDPAAITVMSGSGQNGTVGVVLADSVVVRVTDSKGRPVVDAEVQFIPGNSAAGSDLIPDTATTDVDGRARARWVLGTQAGNQVVTARVIGFTRVTTTITSIASADVADTVFVVAGDSQSGTVGAALADSLKVRVNDQFGNPVSGVVVGWSVSGGGAVDAASVTTGSNGEAAVQRVLGTTAGPQSAAATVAGGIGGSPVVFSHTAVAGGPTALLKIDGDNQTAPAGTFLAESLDVRLVDGSGNGVAGRAVAFTPALSNGTASPVSVVTDVNGFASSRWTLGGTAGAQSLTASGAGFSVIFTATATSDIPTQIAINGGNNQTAVAGTPVATAPSVRVRDANNNGVGNVSVTFTVTGGGGSVSGPSGSGTSTIVATNSSGIATLNSWTLGATAGPNTMSASASGPGGPLTGSPLGFSATGTAGAAAQVAITTQPPTSVASGATFGTAPAIQLRDAGGNPVNQANVNVTVSLATGSGTLNGTKTQQTNASGQATFAGLSISGLVGPYTLEFASGSLTPDTSTTITLTTGAANKLALTTQPSSSAQSGVAFAQQPVIQVQDAAGNPVSQAGIAVTAAIATGGGTLNGTAVVNTNSSGVASFTNLAITGTAGGRTLDFTATGLTKATSTVVTLGAGGATKLGFGVQPTNTAAGAVISPAVTVLVQDASGNTVAGATNSVTIALLANPGGSTLSGTLTVNAVNGVATFSDLSLDKTGTGYTLSVTSSGLTGATSNTFNVTPGGVTQLVFTQQPTNVVAGASIAPAVTVTAQDAQGNTVTGYVTAISLSLGNNPGGGVLTGGGAVVPVNGVATFAALSINRTGTGYTLVANSGSLSKISSAFNVTAGTANQLVFTQQPNNSPAGSNIAPPVQVAVQDALGNTVTSATTAITLAIGNNPPGNGILTGGGPVNAVNGVATFASLQIDKAGTGYTLTANGGGLPTETSAGFDISVGGGNKLVFIVGPSNSQVGEAISPAIQVQIQDAGGNPVPGTNAINLVIANNPGGATLTGGGATNAVNGIATFSNVRLDRVGTGYTLTAQSSGLISATSGSFDISATATTTTITSHTPPLSSRVGQPVTVNFSVAAVAPGSGSPTGQVTVTDGTVNCQANVAAGQCQLFPTTSGAKTLTATYAGDGNFTGSVSAGTPHQVNAANTTTQITSDQFDPSVVGEVVTVNFLVTVNAPGDGTPTGNVTVSAGSDSCVVDVSAGSCSLTLTSAGAKTITAAYPGDGNFNASQDTESHTVNKAGATVTITSDLPDPSGAGEAVIVNYTVLPVAPGAGTPTGNVVVTVSGSSDTCTGTVAAGTCSLTITTTGAGKTITASYAGDANFLTDTDTETHDVTAGGTTTAITSTVPSSSVVGQQVAIHYSVTPIGGGTPTGTVTVSDGTQSCNASVAAGQCNITFTSAGSRNLVATYGGDGNFGGSTSPGFGHQVNTASTTTSITSDTPDPTVIGEAYTVNYAVAVTAPGAGTPTGNVTVSDGTDACVGTAAAGSCSLTSTTSGPKTLTATYDGDGSFTGSTSPGVSHTVNLAATTTTITGDNPDPSVVNTVVNVTYTVSVTGPGSGTPTGNVTVSDGTDSCTGTVAAGNCNITLNTATAVTLTATYEGDAEFAGSTSPGEPHTVTASLTTTSITGHTPSPSVVGAPVTVNVAVTSGAGTPTGTVTVSDGSENCVATLSGGTGSCILTFGTAGARNLTASYSGDGTHGSSSSGGTAHQVDKANTTTAITGDLPDPSAILASVPVTFTVTSASGTPTGNVTVSDGLSSCTATVAQGTCNLTLLLLGTRTLTAEYEGDANFNASTSSGESHDVTLTGTSTGIDNHTPDPSVVGQVVAVQFTVTSSFGTPTGDVSVSDGSASCIGTLSGGSGSCDITLSNAGGQTLTATYLGGGSFSGSSSSGVAHTVLAFGPVDPGSTIATVPDGVSGSQTSITIQTRDQFGNPVGTGGATVAVTISGLNTDTAVVSDNNDGSYTAVYTPVNGGGVDNVTITVDGTPIQGSPFSSAIS